MAVRHLFNFWMFKHLEREKLQTETQKDKQNNKYNSIQIQPAQWEKVRQNT